MAAVACALVFLFVSVPSADVFTFGIHEHTATVDREGDADDLSRPVTLAISFRTIATSHDTR